MKKSTEDSQHSSEANEETKEGFTAASLSISGGASSSQVSTSSFAIIDQAKKKKKIKSDVLFEDIEHDVQEYDDCIVIRGNVLKKPFIEKPINAEDHEIMIHYSNSSPCGSGYSVLFRKTESTCS